MRRRLAAGAAGVLALAALAWLALRHGPADDASAKRLAAPAPPVAASAPAHDVLDRGGAMPMAAARAARGSSAKKRTLYDDFLEAREYRGLYARLNGTPEGATPKGRLVMFELLKECASVAGGVPRPYRSWGRPPKRDDFIASLAPNDPSRARRIAAYDQFTLDHCAGMPSVTVTSEELVKLVRDSAAGGEPAAKAIQIEMDLWATRFQPGAKPSLSDAQIATLQQAAGSRDPEAIRVAGRVLANTWTDNAIRVGPEALPIEPRPFVGAFLVLACEYGAPCGADTPRMQQACALQGYCDAQTYPDYLAYYASTPHDSTLLMQYRNLLRSAIETGDWSQIQVVRGQSQPSGHATFIPGPR